MDDGRHNGNQGDKHTHLDVLHNHELLQYNHMEMCQYVPNYNHHDHHDHSNVQIHAHHDVDLQKEVHARNHVLDNDGNDTHDDDDHDYVDIHRRSDACHYDNNHCYDNDNADGVYGA